MTDQNQLLDEALSRGILSNEQRAQIAALKREQATDNDERIKPVGTFNEIFVTVGVIVLMNAVHGLLAVALSRGVFTEVVMVLALWATALFFETGKRFRLPIIYCCLSAAVTTGLMIYQAQIGHHAVNVHSVPPGVVLISLAAALLILGAGAARFRVPFLMLPIGVLFTVLITYAAQHLGHTMSLRLILGACGLAILAVAVRFDLKDPQRVNRWSDFAFWSYLIGSPLFVHSLLLSLLLHHDKALILSLGNLLLMASLIMLVTFAGILINRRALILSTMLYVGFVIFRLLAGIAMSAGITLLLVTLLIIGLYIIALGSRWTRVRHYMMTRLPHWKWLKRLPPH